MSDKCTKILLIEDNPGDVRLIQEMLTQAIQDGYQLECADRLSKGLKRLGMGGIDLVLLDLGLPDSQGLRTFDKVHAQAPAVPIVLLTGLDDKMLALQAVRQGAQDYLVKGNVDSTVLCRAVRHAVERKQVEEEIRRARDDYLAITNLTGDIIVHLDKEGRCTFLNDGACEFWGKPREKLLGIQFADYVHPDDAKKTAAAIQHVIKTKEILRGWLNRQETPKGWRTVEWNVSPILDEAGNYAGIQATGRDITERKRAEEARQESEEKYRTILEDIEEGYFEVNIAGNFTFFNDPMCEINGYSRDEMMGMNNRQYMDKKNAKKLYQAFNRVYTTGKPSKEFGWEITRKDGAKRFIEASVSLKRNSEGEPIGFRGIIRDITERKRAEEELRKHREHLEELVEERTKELQDAQERLVRSEKLAVIGQLAGGVSHELRNPLGAIKNASYFLNMAIEQPEQEVKETLEILEKEVATSERIISSLLEFARPKPATLQNVHINEVIEESLCRVTVPENVKVVMHLDETLPIILADPGQLGRVFINIILNAIQAMPEGGQLVIKSEVPGPKWVDVSFTDTGVGILEKNMRKLFEPLFTTKAKGIGLGLAICRTMVEEHGGTIELHSIEGKGSIFTISLPVGKKEEQ